MQLITTTQARALDSLALKELNIEEDTLMNNATNAFTELFAKRYSPENKIAIFCGRGKNGGDGFYIAKKLRNLGYPVTTVPCFEPDSKLNPLTLEAFSSLMSDGASISDISDIKECNVVIDAILGTGSQGDIGGNYLFAIEKINSLKAKKISVDCPSGLNCDNGKIANICVKADETYTMALSKVGMNIHPGVEYCGEVFVLDIGIPKSLYSRLNIKTFLCDNRFAKSLYPKRPQNSHKGIFGKVGVFGGSEGMCGSVVMASEAVLRAGAGMVFTCVNENIFDTVSQKLTEAIIKKEKDYKEVYENTDVCLVGPGYISKTGITHIMKLAQQNEKPLVVDAEGLNYINKKDRRCPLVLTPHPKEFSKMIGLGVEEINNNRIYLSQKYAKENNCVLVLKGAKTVIASPKGEVRINKSGSSSLATAGSGDVLSGLIAGLIAQGLSPFDGATLGVYLHGLAGELGAREMSEYSLKASDILNYIGKAFLYYE